MPQFELVDIDVDAHGSFYVAAMEETYLISFASTEPFRAWSGPTGNKYLEKLKRRSADPMSFCRTLLIDGMAVGLIEASALSDSRQGRTELIGYVAFIFVSRDFRGAGVGAHLLTAAVKWAKQARLSELNLTVELNNKAAISFYKTHGWIDSGPSPKSPGARSFTFKISDR